MLPLTEEAFTTDSADVDTYPVNFVTRNETAMRTKMQTTKTITKTRGSVTCCHLNVIL